MAQNVEYLRDDVLLDATDPTAAVAFGSSLASIREVATFLIQPLLDLEAVR